jgi:hypothetical protein
LNYGNRWGSPNAKRLCCWRWQSTRGPVGNAASWVCTRSERQVRRLQQLVERYGESPLWGLGVAGLRDVLDGMTVAEALEARGLDRCGAPKRVTEGVGHG